MRKKIFNDNDTKRILIVDDEPFNVLGLFMMVKQTGYGDALNFVDRAYNGLEAIERVEKLFTDSFGSYGLIFMDISMPFLDGYEATDCIRSFYREREIE